MTWLFWLIVLPFSLTLLLLPRCSACNVDERYPNWNNPIKVKHILLALFIGVIPVLNYAAVLLCIYVYVSSYEEAFNGKFFDKKISEIFGNKKET